MNSLNISFSNCFIGEIEPEYPLNELIDMIYNTDKNDIKIVFKNI